MRAQSDTAKPVRQKQLVMSRLTDDPLTPLGVLVGLFLILVGVGTIVTAPWQYQPSTTVTVLRIIGTVGTILIGIGMIYIAWGMNWLAARRAS